MTTNLLTKKSKEQLRAEAEALAAQLDKMNSEMAALEKAEREAQELERLKLVEVEREKKRLASVLKYQKVAVEIVTKLNMKGFKNAGIRPAENHHSDYPVIVVLGAGAYDRECSVSFESNYREKYPYIIVGSSNKSRYPVRKDGTYNVDKIVSTVVQRYEASVAESERQDKRNSNAKQSKALVLRLMKRFSVLRKKSYTGDKIDSNSLYSYESLKGLRLEETVYYSDRVKVSLENMSLKEEDAVELIEFITDFKERMDMKYKEVDND